MYVIIFLLIPLRYQNDPLDNIKKKMTFINDSRNYNKFPTQSISFSFKNKLINRPFNIQYFLFKQILLLFYPHFSSNNQKLLKSLVSSLYYYL